VVRDDGAARDRRRAAAGRERHRHVVDLGAIVERLGQVPDNEELRQVGEARRHQGLEVGIGRDRERRQLRRDRLRGIQVRSDVEVRRARHHQAVVEREEVERTAVLAAEVEAHPIRATARIRAEAVRCLVRVRELDVKVRVARERRVIVLDPERFHVHAALLEGLAVRHEVAVFEDGAGADDEREVEGDHFGCLGERRRRGEREPEGEDRSDEMRALAQERDSERTHGGRRADR
jgi:hypothetical protein